MPWITLLKPFNYEEFLRAANKALSYYELVNRPDTKSLPAANDNIEDEYLFLKVEYQLVRIALSDIIYIESLKDYVKVWVKRHRKSHSLAHQFKSFRGKTPSQTIYANSPLLYSFTG